MSYSDAITEDIRLRLLQLLAQAPEYTQPEAALGAALGDQYGHRIGSVRLAAEAAWLDEAALVTRLPVGHTAILTLTPRGLDVARGRSQAPGVARPQPGE